MDFLGALQNRIFPPPGQNLHQGMDQSRDRNPAQWIDQTREDYQPSLFAAPQANMLQSQVSGYWKGPLARVMQYFSKNSKSLYNFDEIAKEAKLSTYEAETLVDLLKMNK